MTVQRLFWRRVRLYQKWLTAKQSGCNRLTSQKRKAGISYPAYLTIGIENQVRHRLEGVEERRFQILCYPADAAMSDEGPQKESGSVSRIPCSFWLPSRKFGQYLSRIGREKRNKRGLNYHFIGIVDLDDSVKVTSGFLNQRTLSIELRHLRSHLQTRAGVRFIRPVSALLNRLFFGHWLIRRAADSSA
jgi:hypothetical protein